VCVCVCACVRAHIFFMRRKKGTSKIIAFALFFLNYFTDLKFRVYKKVNAPELLRIADIF